MWASHVGVGNISSNELMNKLGTKNVTCFILYKCYSSPTQRNFYRLVNIWAFRLATGRDSASLSKERGVTDNIVVLVCVKEGDNVMAFSRT